MNDAITQAIIISAGILGVICLGICMILLSRTARKRNAILKNKGNQLTPTEAIRRVRILTEGGPGYSKSYQGDMAESLPMSVTIIGKLLAVLVIIIVLVFLGFCLLLLFGD